MFFVCFRNRFMFVWVVFDTGSKHRNTPRNLPFSFKKQTEKQPKQIVIRFYSFFFLIRGLPYMSV
jgi:hypothetical protein